MERLISFLGLMTMMALAWAVSNNRRKMNFRLIVSGVGLQLAIGVVLLWLPLGRDAFAHVTNAVNEVIQCSQAGAEFVFGDFILKEKDTFWQARFATTVLPMIIFLSSLMAVLFHLGIIQLLVKGMAWLMVRVMDASGSESLAAAANVFLGMTTAPLAIKPYLARMTQSELMAMMTGGMASVSVSIIGAYWAAGADMGDLLIASLMSAPASLVIAKIMIPETEESLTKGVVKIEIPRQDANVLDAACRGASEGLKLALNVAAMLIAFVAIVALLNLGLSALVPNAYGEPLTLERLFGWCLAPLAWIMGVPWCDAQEVGMLLGKKTILNELLAFQDLGDLKGQISDRSFTIATYALCGFANFGSIAVMIGGIGGLVPSRRKDLAKFGLRALLGGALAAFMTASIAGMLI
ncbi:MAG: NupC/NupG family nucleoside CNT transporter [Planctomycetes bacterium]|nr:NupC/NupG family nucleoside CNT transporter [Planctomycetota bacterium]